MIRIQHLRLRAFTAGRTFGTDIPFKTGLNIIQAHNTSGKSTSLQAIIYALGLERSLGPQLTIPLPYAMREQIHAHKDEPYEPVLQSYVELEIANGQGRSVIIRRDVVGGKESRLIQTWSRGSIAIEGSRTDPRDFFVRDAGAAQHPDGFHFFLTEFMGWSLPAVPRFDGSEGPLYLEAIFPMLFVEQKRGWSAIQGPFPTYLKIQDVARRVMEFLLDLDAGKIRRQRSEIRAAVGNVNQKWVDRRKVLEEQAGKVGRMRGLPLQPTAEFAQAPDMKFEIFRQDEWQDIEEAIRRAAARIQELEDQQTPATGTIVPELTQKLEQARHDVDAIAASLEVLRSETRGEVQEEQGLKTRLDALRADLIRNQDAQKLKRFGSELGQAAGDHICPTCHQDVSNELLPAIEHVGMGLEENIAFVKSQIQLYETAYRGAADRLADCHARYRSKEDELKEKQSELRALRQALVQPNSAPTRVIIEEIVRTQSFVDRVTSFEEAAAIAADELRAIAEEWARLIDQLRRLPPDELTTEDNNKISAFQTSIQKSLALYDFKSFTPSEIVLSRDNFRPLALTRTGTEEVEKEINFEVSASDGIRLKWAYYLSLLSLSVQRQTNHAGVVIFDEPGQQEIEAKSLYAFLRDTAGRTGVTQQAIVSTSEPLSAIEGIAGEGANIISFDGFMLQPLAGAPTTGRE